MKRNIAYKFRIYPTEEQKVLITKTFGCCRFLWNKMLSDKQAAYEQEKVNLKTSPAKYKTEFSWLSEVDSHALCSVQMNLEKAYKVFFTHQNNFPKFKSKHHSKKSYTSNIANGSISIVKNGIKLPKLGVVSMKITRHIPSNYNLKSVTVSQSSSDKYFVSILFEYESQEIHKELDKNNAIGLDYSSHDFYVDSEGNKANYSRFFRIYENKLAKEQRKWSRMIKGSNNWLKQKIKVAKVHEKISNSRKEFCNTLSTKLANTFDYVCIEDINLQGIAQCFTLGKSTNDNGFGMFRTMLSYKLELRGKKLLKIGRFQPSTIVCSTCGCCHKDIVNSLSVRHWACPDCGTYHDRDINAAINIKQIAISQL